jgi:hypothetical protein
VRLHEFSTKAALLTRPDGKTEYRCEYFEEPNGNIPSWAVSWAMDKCVDSMINGILKHMELFKRN